MYDGIWEVRYITEFMNENSNPAKFSEKKVYNEEKLLRIQAKILLPAGENIGYFDLQIPLKIMFSASQL